MFFYFVFLSLYVWLCFILCMIQLPVLCYVPLFRSIQFRALYVYTYIYLNVSNDFISLWGSKYIYNTIQFVFLLPWFGLYNVFFFLYESLWTTPYVHFYCVAVCVTGQANNCGMQQWKLLLIMCHWQNFFIFAITATYRIHCDTWKPLDQCGFDVCRNSITWLDLES